MRSEFAGALSKLFQKNLKCLPKESASSHFIHIFSIKLGCSNTLLKECNYKMSGQLESYYEYRIIQSMVVFLSTWEKE